MTWVSHAGPSLVLSSGTASAADTQAWLMSHVRLTPDEARRALYVDFEGRKVGPPVLLGCTTKSRVRSQLSVWQAVTDPILTPLAIADDIEALSLADAVERILVRAERKDRLIVAWSERELDVVREHCPQHLDRFEARFRNAREFAVRWRNKCHDGRRPPTNALADYLRAHRLHRSGGRRPRPGGGDHRDRPARPAARPPRVRPDRQAAPSLGRPARAQPPRLRGHAPHHDPRGRRDRRGGSPRPAIERPRPQAPIGPPPAPAPPDRAARPGAWLASWGSARQASCTGSGAAGRPRCRARGGGTPRTR